jgi:hypothetical protein
MRFDSDPQIRGPGRPVEVRREVWIVQPAIGASQSFALLRFGRRVHEGLEGVWNDDCGRNSFGCWDQKERRSLLTVLPAPIIAGLVFYEAVEMHMKFYHSLTLLLPHLDQHR